MAYRLGIDHGTTNTVASIAANGAPAQLGYFTSIDLDADETMPGQAAPSPSRPQAPAPTAGSPAVGSSPQTGSTQQRPGSAPSPGPYGPNLPEPGPPLTQPHGAGGGPGGPGDYPPGPAGDGSGGSGSKLISIIASAVVLVGVAVGVGFLISGRGEPGRATASPSGFFPPVSPPGQSPTPSASSSQTPSGAPSASARASPSGTPSSSTAQKLPSSAAIPQSVVIVPMRFNGGPDRPLYLVDTERKIKQVELPSPDGGNSNPIMLASRNTIIYANGGVLRVMAADGSGDRKLFNRDPAGCDKVAHASWSLTDPNVILLTCKLSTGKFGLLVVGLDGRLIRRLDAGKKVIGDAGISPDGQTVLYWASDNSNQEGGAIYTLPVIGTGEPKPLTNSAAGVDADPAWSPDGTQIAFRRKVLGSNEDVFVMNADGSGVRAVATTPAADFKPIWSPDSKNLLIISDRKSALGGPGSTFDLWLTRASDGQVLTNLDLKARQITRPFWTQR
jgi:WD40-like Beta Propeller Repeat